MKRIAVIDCGTNTFNLGIYSVYPTFSTIHKQKILVKLGTDLNTNKIISEDACRRATETIKNFHQIISEYSCEKVIAIGTSAFRDSKNGKELVKKIFKETGIFIEIIDGEREAELIAGGIRFAMKNIPHTSLILDIGGGSNECILMNNSDIFWKKSYPLGIGRLLGEKPHSNPIVKEEVSYFENLFIKEMEETWDVCKKCNPVPLIGASGAFDSVWDMAFACFEMEMTKLNPTIHQNNFCFISPEIFYKLYEMILKSTREERNQMKGLSELRREMIVLSFILIDIVFRYSGCKEIICCRASLKEGVLSEILNKQEG